MLVRLIATRVSGLSDWKLMENSPIQAIGATISTIAREASVTILAV